MTKFSRIGKKEQACVMYIVYLLRDKKDLRLEDIVPENNSTNIPNFEFVEIVNERIEEMKNNPAYNDIMEELLEVQQFAFSDETSSFVFVFKDEKRFSISADNLLQRVKFDAAYVSATSKVPIGDSTSYRIFLANVLSGSNVKRIKKEKESDEVGEARDAILRFIENATLVDNVSKTKFAQENLFIEDGSVYVPSTTIRRIIDREKISITLRKLRVSMDDYLKGSSKKMRMSDKTVRYWLFDIKKLGFNMDLKIVHGGEEQEDDAETSDKKSIKDLAGV